MFSRDRNKLQIAREVARLLAEEGIHDKATALRKATARLGIAAKGNLPNAEEIDCALDQHHRLYRSDIQDGHISALRKLALEAMRFLVDFSPLLVGGVWDGSAGKFSPIILHLFPHSPEEVLRKLLDAGIPFEEKSHAQGTPTHRSGEHPGLSFYADGTRIDLMLFPPDWQKRFQKRRDGRPTGGTAAELIELLERQHDREA